MWEDDLRAACRPHLRDLAPKDPDKETPHPLILHKRFEPRVV